MNAAAAPAKAGTAVVAVPGKTGTNRARRARDEVVTSKLTSDGRAEHAAGPHSISQGWQDARGSARQGRGGEAGQARARGSQ